MLPILKTGLGAVVTMIIRTNLGLRMAAAAAGAVLAAAAAVRPATAQDAASPVSVDVSECVKLTTPEERLACFERQVESSRTNPPAPGATSTGSAPPAGSTSNDSGRGEPPPADIEARIAELRETVPNAYLITLDNGQVWRQTVPRIYPLQAGHPVRIYYSKWRSYRLTNETLKGFIQVERVR
jgi:hypothetical protein